MVDYRQADLIRTKKSDYAVAVPFGIMHFTDHFSEEKVAMLQNLGSPYPAATQNGSPPSLSSPSSNYDICRICHCEAEIDAPLIAPCYCAGSLLYVHQSCLQQWIKSSDTRKCELCKFEFIMQTKIKPFTQWEKLDITAVERRKIFCSVTFHVVAITCVVWSLYVLIDRTAEEVRNGTLEWPFWTKLIVVAIGFTGGLVFMYVQCKMYVHLCRRWKAFNRIIFIQDAPSKAMMAAAMNDAANLGSFNCSSFNSVQVLDHPVVVAALPQPLFSTTKCETILTTTETVSSVVTCIEMTPSRFMIPETKVVTSTTNATYSPISPLPPSTVTLNLPLLVPTSENAQILNNSLINNNNNNDNSEQRNLEAISQPYSNNCQLQMEKVS